MSTVELYDATLRDGMQGQGMALSALEKSGQAASLVEDELSEPRLAQSTKLVESTEANSLGRDGSGEHIAILDTGVDGAHASRAGKGVSAACGSDGD